MGDGLHLKQLLKDKGTNVRRIAKETGISPTTLYSIIQNDSNIRFEYAVQLANVLDVDVNEICLSSPLSNQMLPIDTILDTSSSINDTLNDNRLKMYIKESLYPLISLLGTDHMADFDRLIRTFYQLDDETRKEIVETVQFKLNYHKDSDREEKIEQIKEW